MQGVLGWGLHGGCKRAAEGLLKQKQRPANWTSRLAENHLWREILGPNFALIATNKLAARALLENKRSQVVVGEHYVLEFLIGLDVLNDQFLGAHFVTANPNAQPS